MSTTARDSGAGAYSNLAMACGSSGSVGCGGLMGGSDGHCWGARTVIAGGLARSVQAGRVVGDVVRAGVGADRHPLALQDEVVEQARGPEPEPVRIEPVVTGDLADRDEELERVLAGADAAGRLHADHLAGELAPVADRLEHDER